MPPNMKARNPEQSERIKKRAFGCIFFRFRIRRGKINENKEETMMPIPIPKV